ncbi:MAG: hypothetical protein HYT22_02970 [Candidatus Niyogibacteria bacterium]|nr:hypothetical protein [Candidatus Niyogibacteria bacterium]
MERALFAAFEGWQNRKREAEKADLESWMKTARESETRRARAAYHEIAARWIKQKLGKNFSPARALVELAEKETALLYAYGMKWGAPSESRRLKKAERWQYRQPHSCKTAAAAVLMTGGAPDAIPFVLGYAMAALSGGNTVSATRHWMDAQTRSAIERIIISRVDATTPPIQWWLESRLPAEQACHAKTGAHGESDTVLSRPPTAETDPEHQTKTHDIRTDKILQSVIRTVGLPESHYEKIRRVKIAELAARRAGCRWASPVWIPLNKKTRYASRAHQEQRLYDHIHRGLADLARDMPRFKNKTIDETVRFIIREQWNPR